MTALDRPRDVAEGVAGMLGIALDLATPFLRGVRSRWGVSRAQAMRSFVGDEHVPHPDWSWTHAIEIDAPADRVWPWVAQIGQDKAGFYSYQWLENLAGCRIQNADAIHPEWTAIHVGDELRLHPAAPPLRITTIEVRRLFVASGVFDPSTGRLIEDGAERAGRWVQASWLFLVEPVGAERCRLVSRHRVAHDRDRRTRAMYGPWLTESIGFVMDRRMLIGVKQRAERHAPRHAAPPP